MKAKIIMLSVVLIALLESCASHCGNKSYRTQRFVQIEPAEATSQARV